MARSELWWMFPAPPRPVRSGAFLVVPSVVVREVREFGVAALEARGTCLDDVSLATLPAPPRAV